MDRNEELAMVSVCAKNAAMVDLTGYYCVYEDLTNLSRVAKVKVVE